MWTYSDEENLPGLKLVGKRGCEATQLTNNDEKVIEWRSNNEQKCAINDSGIYINIISLLLQSIEWENWENEEHNTTDDVKWNMRFGKWRREIRFWIRKVEIEERESDIDHEWFGLKKKTKVGWIAKRDAKKVWFMGCYIINYCASYTQEFLYIFGIISFDYMSNPI